MKNIFKTPIIILALITAFFSSCEKYKTCQITFETLNGYSMSDLDAAASAMGYSDWTSYMESLYPSEELCGDALDEAEEVVKTLDKAEKDAHDSLKKAFNAIRAGVEAVCT